MWLWPFIFDGGSIRYALVLNDEGGNEVWSETFKASSFWISLGGAYGYEKRIRKGMTRILEDIEVAIRSEEFVTALNSAQPSGTRAPVVIEAEADSDAPAPVLEKSEPSRRPRVTEPRPSIDESADAKLRAELEERMKRVTP